MAAAKFEVLRERLIARHLDPKNREVYREVTLRNDGGEPGHECLVVLDHYLPGLWIEDGVGTELTYLPRRVMEEEVGTEQEILEQLGVAEGNPDARVVVVQFAEAVEPDETVLLKLHHHDPKSRGDWRLLPRYWFEFSGPDSLQAHDTFFEAEAPQEGRVVLVQRKLTNVDLRPEHGTGDMGRLRLYPRFLQLRSPGPAKGVSLWYRVVPIPSEFCSYNFRTTRCGPSPRSYCC